MRALDARDILRLWESCQALHPIDRSLEILRIGTDAAWDELVALPLGERERRAAALRIHSFGVAAEGAATCPACGVVHELELPLAEVAAAPPVAADAWVAEVDDLTLALRVPDSRDLAAVAGCVSEADAVRVLLARCVTEVARDGEPVAVAAIPDTAVGAIAALIEARDGTADLRISLRCVSCDHAWDECLDAGEYLWLEIRDRARRLLYEVGVLARAFHWSEDAILSMSTRRRTAYLEMVAA